MKLFTTELLTHANFEALIRTTAVGDISNTATITYNGTQQDSTVVMTPKDSEFVATKTNVQTEYVPGEELEFLITIQNTSNNNAISRI